ncbi:hypothetical protein SteCoe_21433 [Stentor coeruleus]|uniref:FCP1 homology domain-containing protein n=1 Tax=Stentor coeruleus TaxID=5963 RepID=A0A1R2BPH8_9CILI|nr:hypothetical protein SteCoe_21433 [Stentor coeruleus]
MSRSQKRLKQFSKNQKPGFFSKLGIENIPEQTADTKKIQSQSSSTKIISSSITLSQQTNIKILNALCPEKLNTLGQQYKSPLSPQSTQILNTSRPVSSTPKPIVQSNSLQCSFVVKPNNMTTRNQIEHSRSLTASQSLESIVSNIKQNHQRLNRSKNIKVSDSERSYKEHLFQTFQALKLVKTLPEVNLLTLQQKKIKIPRKKGWENRKTIVFDLDETLVHCVDDCIETADIVIDIHFPSGEIVKAGVNIRPFAKECLQEASKYFEVIIFTASHKYYADEVLNHLDPQNEYINYRLYRENCILAEGVHIKDLRILKDRKLKNTVIVDNCAYSFAYQLENGIPIISWHDDPSDRELYNLMDYLKVLAGAHDIRDVNREVFHLNTFYEDYLQEYLNKNKTRF